MFLTFVQEAGSKVTKEMVEKLVANDFPAASYPCSLSILPEILRLGYMVVKFDGALYEITAKGQALLARDQAAQPEVPAQAVLPATSEAGDFEKLRDRGIELKKLLESAKAQNSTLETEITSNRAKAKELEKTKSQLEAEHARIEERLAKSTRDIGNTRGAILALEAKARMTEEKITAGVSGMEAELEEVKKKLRAMMPEL